LAGVYIDTTALGRILLGEPDAAAVVRDLSQFDQHVSSHLLRTELCRLALRHGLLGAASQLLATVALVPLDDVTLAHAETLRPASLATLDAMHLAAALRLASEGLVHAIMTHDHRLAEAAQHHGLAVVSPS
jgi:uncharacterized protein